MADTAKGQKRRALIVGAGHWARAWGRILKGEDQVEVAGWVDIRRGVAAGAARELEFGKIHTGTDLDRAIAATRPDFVLNLTVPEAHCAVAVQALEAGLPVLCEKPMADSLEHAREMVAASERTGNLLMISQQRRYDTRLATMRRLIVEHLGPPGILSSDFFRAHPEAPFQLGMTSPLLLDMAIHTFDAARFVCGADPVAVYCEHFNSPWSWFKGNASAIAVFEMTGGLRYIYRGSWTSHGWDTTWEAEWRAVGPNGTVAWDGRTAPEAEIVAQPGVFPPSKRRIRGEPEGDGPASLSAPLRDFLHALETGATPMGECHDNIKSLGMVFGAIESAGSGQRVPIHV